MALMCVLRKPTDSGEQSQDVGVRSVVDDIRLPDRNKSKAEAAVILNVTAVYSIQGRGTVAVTAFDARVRPGDKCVTESGDSAVVRAIESGGRRLNMGIMLSVEEEIVGRQLTFSQYE